MSSTQSADCGDGDHAKSSHVFVVAMEKECALEVVLHSDGVLQTEQFTRGT